MTREPTGGQVPAQERGAASDDLFACLVELWARENLIKTIKLQALLLTHAVLAVGYALAAGGRAGIAATGAALDLVWLFSIGRTCLFQDAWRAKLEVLRAAHPEDARYGVLETRAERARGRIAERVLGALPSRVYLLGAPLAGIAAWLAALWVELSSRG